MGIIQRQLPQDVYNALLAAEGPTQENPFATVSGQQIFKKTTGEGIETVELDGEHIENVLIEAENTESGNGRILNEITGFDEAVNPVSATIDQQTSNTIIRNRYETMLNETDYVRTESVINLVNTGLTAQANEYTSSTSSTVNSELALTKDAVTLTKGSSQVLVEASGVTITNNGTHIITPSKLPLTTTDLTKYGKIDLYPTHAVSYSGYDLGTKFTDDGAGSTGIRCKTPVTFTQFFEFSLPYEYKGGTDLEIWLKWAGVSNGGTGTSDIKFYYEHVWIPGSGAIPNSTIDSIVLAHSSITSKDIKLSKLFTVSGTGKTKDDSAVHFRLTRTDGDAADTYQYGVYVLELYVRYIKDKFGDTI